MAAFTVIQESAPPRMTYLSMNELEHGGFITSYRGDVQHNILATPHVHAGPDHLVVVLTLRLHPRNTGSYRVPYQPPANLHDALEPPRKRFTIICSQLPPVIRLFRALQRQPGDVDRPTQIQPPFNMATARLLRAFDVVEVNMRFWRPSGGVPAVDVETWTCKAHEVNVWVPYDPHMRPTEVRFARFDGLAPTAGDPNPLVIQESEF
ncbi:hypothetical protein IWX90DRAFT_500539 [Phyllosticta citrichinensis]|uniref:Uncharacterized protein n=1 Tax=Phyllosticta citrichinensis TaxID=1130410 RepID=A0ABR1Y146_9PEZI